MKHSISSRPFKDAIYQQFARIGKALSSPKRLELLELLSQSPKTVETLARETTMSIANVSQHLQTMLEAQLVRFQKQGTYALYELADQNVSDFLFVLRKLGEHRLAVVPKLQKEFFQNFDQTDPLNIHDLMERIQSKKVKLIDVRPAQEYAAGHIPEAASFPIYELEKHISELPKDKEIIVYCRGPYCVYAAQAVELLRSHGFEALRLEGGIQDWREVQERNLQ